MAGVGGASPYASLSKAGAPSSEGRGVQVIVSSHILVLVGVGEGCLVIRAILGYTPVLPLAQETAHADKNDNGDDESDEDDDDNQPSN